MSEKASRLVYVICSRLALSRLYQRVRRGKEKVPADAFSHSVREQ